MEQYKHLNRGQSLELLRHFCRQYSSPSHWEGAAYSSNFICNWTLSSSVKVPWATTFCWLRLAPAMTPREEESFPCSSQCPGPLDPLCRLSSSTWACAVLNPSILDPVSYRQGVQVCWRFSLSLSAGMGAEAIMTVLCWEKIDVTQTVWNTQGRITPSIEAEEHKAFPVSLRLEGRGRAEGKPVMIIMKYKFIHILWEPWEWTETTKTLLHYQYHRDLERQERD